jgi:hypothetical protein
MSSLAKKPDAPVTATLLNSAICLEVVRSVLKS